MFNSSTYTSRGRFKRTKFTASTVDETLFGERRTTQEPDPVPKFEPPWVDKSKPKPPKPLLFYCPTSPSRSLSRTSITTPERKYKPVKFSPTVVDHTLFGDTTKQHDLKMDKFFTSMPPKQLNVDDIGGIGNVDKECEKSSRSMSARTTRPDSSNGRRQQQKPLPPWR